jgi:hypothetical protein
MQKVQAGWKNLPHQQGGDDTLWELTRNYSSYIVKNHGLILSRDPLNLTGLNTKRDSGIANSKAIGIGFSANDRKVKERKAKKKAKVVRINLRIKTRRALPKKRLTELKKDTIPTSNNAVYSERPRITVRAAVKALQRDLAGYRKDLVAIAVRRLRRIHKFKRANKRQNKLDAKKVKA